MNKSLQLTLLMILLSLGLWGQTIIGNPQNPPPPQFAGAPPPPCQEGQPGCSIPAESSILLLMSGIVLAAYFMRPVRVTDKV